MTTGVCYYSLFAVDILVTDMALNWDQIPNQVRNESGHHIFGCKCPKAIIFGIVEVAMTLTTLSNQRDNTPLTIFDWNQIKTHFIY